MILDHLNNAQKNAVTTTEGPLIIIACAGSGKTTALINRVAYLIAEKEVIPESILLLTFTNAAAKNMLDKAKSMSDERCLRINACTYHSFCTKMLREYGRTINLNPNFTILNSTDVTEAIKFVKANKPEYKEKKFPTNKTILKIFSSSVNGNLSLSDLINSNKKLIPYKLQIEQLFKEYSDYKRTKQFCDYDDLLVHFNSLLDNYEICNKIKSRFQYIMIDEYQDTNNLQEQIITKLAGKNSNIAVVGDDYQSIYKFRGSNVNNFLNFPNKFNKCKTITLDINYRSTKEILDLANCIMKNHAHFGFPKNMKDNNKHGIKPQVVFPKSQNEEKEYILSKILLLHKKGVPFSDIAILERESLSSTGLEIALDHEGISYEKLGGKKFLEHVCVQDMLAYLRCLTNPFDELAWFRILKLHPGIGDKYSRDIASLCSKDRNFLENNLYKKKNFYEELLLLKKEFDKNKELDFHSAFNEFLIFYKKLRKRIISIMNTDENTKIDYQEKYKSDEEILDVLKELSLQYTTALQMLDDMSLDNSKLSKNKNDGMLTISTIHSAKGLEWKYVFIIDCVDAILPGEIAMLEKTNGQSENFDEELRCFYVAITRAKEELYIFAPYSIVKNGRYIPTSITPFLNNCEEYYDRN